MRYVLAGYETDEFDLQYPRPKDLLDATRTLTPVAPAAASVGAQGTLVVNCSANWAEVYADGNKVAASTPAKVSLGAGTHTIMAKNPFTSSEDRQEVTVTAGKTDRLILDCK